MNAHVRHFENAANEQISNMTVASQAIGGKVSSLFEQQVAYARRSIDDTGKLAHALLGEPNLEDTMDLQAGFVRDQSAAFMGQCETMAAICRDIAEELMKPARSFVARTGALRA